MDRLTAAVREAIGDAGVNLTQLAKNTGIDYWRLYDTLGAGGRGRHLRADEFMKICAALKLDPWEFVPQGMGRSSKR